jgi:methylenetetrahydrofolate reductase (NADPH)
MQLIRNIYSEKLAARQPVISFEFFPPKTDEGDRNLFEKTIPALAQTRPDFCSVTYGAGAPATRPCGWWIASNASIN